MVSMNIYRSQCTPCSQNNAGWDASTMGAWGSNCSCWPWCGTSPHTPFPYGNCFRPGVAVANLDPATATTQQIATAFNELLASLRGAGLIDRA